jgi:hypothetical protein
MSVITSNPQDNMIEDFDFQEYLLDGYAADTIKKIIDRIVPLKESELILVYPENLGSFFVPLSKDIPKLTLVESNKFENNFGAQLGIRKKGLKNIQMIFSPEPFSYINKNSVLIIRDDKINVERFVRDLYDMGFNNHVVVIDPEVDNPIWKKLPISGFESFDIDHSKNPNWKLLENDPRWKRRTERAQKVIPVAIFKVNKNYKVADKNKIIKDIEKYYQPYFRENPDEIDIIDILNYKDFPYIPRYLPPTAKEKSLYLTLYQVQQPLHYEVMKNIVDLAESKINDLDQKVLHYDAVQSPVTLIPFAQAVKYVNVYQINIKMNRIYEKYDQQIDDIANFHLADYFILKDDLKLYPEIKNVELGIPIRNSLSLIKEGDVVLIQRQDSQSILKDIRDRDVKNITAIVLNLNNEKISRMESIQLISSHTMNVEKFYQQILKAPDVKREIKNLIDQAMNAGRYKFMVEFFLINPESIRKTTERSPSVESSPVRQITSQMNELVLNQDLYQSIEDFEVLESFAKVIIDQFRTLSPDAVKVVAYATLNKIKQGITYGPELEKMIAIVYPKIKD